MRGKGNGPVDLSAGVPMRTHFAKKKKKVSFLESRRKILKKFEKNYKIPKKIDEKLRKF